MNCHELCKKGKKYAIQAGQNWMSRKERLMYVWVDIGMATNNFRFSNQDRLYLLISTLEDRIENLSDSIAFLERNERIRQLEIENNFLDLTCTKFSCKYSPHAIATRVKIKDYDPNAHYPCKKCGGKMVLRSDRITEDLLFELGIKPTF